MAMNTTGAGDLIDDEPQFVHPHSPNLLCPICHELYKNPIITRECGHSFCEVCIFQIDNSLCPLCRRKINLSEVHQNLVLDQLVKELPVYCKYRRLGCNETFPLVSKPIHEKQCKFGPSRCPHAVRGCHFEGTKLKIEDHIRNHCPFEMMHDYILKTEQQIISMKKLLDAQAQEIRELKRKVAEPGLGFSPLPVVARKPSVEDLSHMRSDSPVQPSIPSPVLSPKDKWDILGMQCQQTLSGHARGVTALTYSNVTGHIFSGSHDATIRVWGKTPGSSHDYVCLKIFEGHKYTVWSLVVSEDGKKLFSGSSDCNLICWNVETFERVQALTDNGGKIYTLELKGKLLFSAGADRKIKIWEIDTFSLLKELVGHTDNIWQIAVVDHHLFSGSDDKTIKIWDLKTYECTNTLTQTTTTPSKIISLAVGYGYICAGTDDCKIKIWDSTSFEYRNTLTDHSWEVWQLCISDGLLFSGSFDHTIKVWDMDNFKCIKTLTGHKGYVHSLYLGKNYQLLSGSGDKTIKIWRGFG
eukprot:TRINITY_DN5705_c0_g1_i1.p1 TRINITY_DN5705_c0_g1~~TRINITY_DN5705_c0_g1_i1.p1  ORF type:complete len:525 (-),score=98.33 TRINITY_DN5705_c0_g1_i1:81-1655(-)